MRHLVTTIGMVLLAGMLPGAMAAETAPASKEKKSGTMVRIVCVKSLVDEEALTIASKAEDGGWIEHGTATVRSSYIAPWVKAKVGDLYLARREADGLVPVGSFKVAENVKRPIAILLGGAKTNTYKVNVINPEKLGFRKGMALVTNYSRVPALVMLGKKRMEVMPGKRVAARSVAGKDGMFRMLVGYKDGEGKLIPCYDRYIAANPEARDFLMLFPDSTSGLKVFSLSEFGPFE